MASFNPSDPVSDAFRTAVSTELDEFLAARRTQVLEISPGLAPVAELAEGFTAGGKRLRPAFCVWGYLAVTAVPADPRPLLRAAASLDLLHVSALVHDDVMDASDTRRGQPAAHRQFAALHTEQGLQGDAADFGQAGAILLGDLLLVWSQQLFTRCGLPDEVVSRGERVLEQMRTEVTAGQFLDILAQARPSLDARLRPDEVMAQVRRVVEFKTARYTVVRPLQVGAALAGAAPSVLEPLARYGSAVGRAFQFRDDILGVFGDAAVTGKPAGDDLREGKLTALLAHALRLAGEAEARELAGMVSRSDLGEAEVDRARTIIVGSGALQAVEDEIAAATAEAVSGLAAAPLRPEAKVALENLARAAAERTS
ncbi:MAG: polyprenyl synthetase family protein [Propionicimonas sp.]|uniref:polyprenyl synthetase family protein n=1 Tax=Propionicimonas sp. TaxID=1955623 RepID=UPI002B21F8A2|nr:polyprenyl synthetase family protein [Propionicimonas sp.]MEA4943293.1 polyprenyl synthetase family protein [Propionicimonas sp.]